MRFLKCNFKNVSQRAEIDILNTSLLPRFQVSSSTQIYEDICPRDELCLRTDVDRGLAPQKYARASQGEICEKPKAQKCLCYREIYGGDLDSSYSIRSLNGRVKRYQTPIMYLGRMPPCLSIFDKIDAITPQKRGEQLLN